MTALLEALRARVAGHAGGVATPPRATGGRVLQLGDADPLSPDMARQVARVLGADAYAATLGGDRARLVGADGREVDLLDVLAAHGRHVVEEVAQDPLEAMLVELALLSHARAAHLSEQAVRQVALDPLMVLHRAANGASDSYRRLMLALADYRRHGTAAGGPPIVVVRAVLTGEEGSPARSYELSEAGLASLRAANRRTKPWLQATGPRTPEGKARSRLNGLKHGRRATLALGGVS